MMISVDSTTPTVLRMGPYRFHFYADEANEPPHNHDRAPEGECKSWLAPVQLARNRGLKPHALREIERLVYEHQEHLKEK
jgi:hypothetical protein